MRNSYAPLCRPRGSRRSSFENEIRNGWQKEGGERANRRGESEFRVSRVRLSKERHTRCSPRVSHIRTCAFARFIARHCRKKSGAPGAPKPFRVDQMSLLYIYIYYCVAPFFSFSSWIATLNAARNRNAIRRPLIVQIGPSRETRDSYLSR